MANSPALLPALRKPQGAFLRADLVPKTDMPECDKAHIFFMPCIGWKRLDKGRDLV